MWLCDPSTDPAPVCLTYYFRDPSNPLTPHYPVLFSKIKLYEAIIIFFLEGGEKKAAEFLMVMYVNLMTVSLLSQFCKIGNEFCVVLDKWKID